MTEEDYLALVSGRAGQFTRLKWRRNVKLSAANKHILVEKETIAVVRTGIEYNALASVQEKREDGRLPAEPQELPWGVWTRYPYIIEHKNEIYARIYPAINKVPTVKWYMNGNLVDKASILGYMTPSDARRESQTSTPPDCFTLKLENIESVN